MGFVVRTINYITTPSASDARRFTPTPDLYIVQIYPCFPMRSACVCVARVYVGVRVVQTNSHEVPLVFRLYFSKLVDVIGIDTGLPRSDFSGVAR